MRPTKVKTLLQFQELAEKKTDLAVNESTQKIVNQIISLNQRIYQEMGTLHKEMYQVRGDLHEAILKLHREINQHQDEVREEAIKLRTEVDFQLSGVQNRLVSIESVLNVRLNIQNELQNRLLSFGSGLFRLILCSGITVYGVLHLPRLSAMF